MEPRKMYSFNTGGSPLGTIVGLVLFSGVLYLLFSLTKFVLGILLWASPFLLIATLIINRKVVTDYIQMIAGLFKRNPISGGIGLALTVVGFPLVSLYLFGKAMLIKKAQEAQRSAPSDPSTYRESDLVDYEELESKPLELPRPQRQQQAPPPQKDDKYDEFFES